MILCQALDHAVLLRAVRRDEFLLQAVAAYQRGVAAAGEYQIVPDPGSFIVQAKTKTVGATGNGAMAF